MSGDQATATDRFRYVIALADDSLISAQRLGWWISRAPELEEDVALANIGLDQLGQARMLLTHAGEVEGRGRTDDDLAYWRDERDFHNVCLVEREQTDFGVAMARLLVFATWQHELWTALSSSTDDTLAAIAAKAIKEVDYHVDHAHLWTLRLGDGTPQSHDRMQAAIDAEWPWMDELFSDFHLTEALLRDGTAVDPRSLEQPVRQRLADVVGRATLTVPDAPAAYSRGRQGRHSEQFGYLLAQMQHLTRSHPGATW